MSLKRKSTASAGDRCEWWGQRGRFLGTQVLGNLESGKDSGLKGRKESLWGNKKKWLMSQFKSACRVGKTVLISGERKCLWKFKRDGGHSQTAQDAVGEARL